VVGPCRKCGYEKAQYIVGQYQECAKCEGKLADKQAVYCYYACFQRHRTVVMRTGVGPPYVQCATCDQPAGLFSTATFSAAA
jgi:hypothetical protein